MQRSAENRWARRQPSLESSLNVLIYRQVSIVSEYLYPHFRSLFGGSFFWISGSITKHNGRNEWIARNLSKVDRQSGCSKTDAAPERIRRQTLAPERHPNATRTPPERRPNASILVRLPAGRPAASDICPGEAEKPRNKPAEAKLAEAMPAEAMPVKQRLRNTPCGTHPAEARPAEAKLAEAKPAEQTRRSNPAAAAADSAK